jgi:hypothetical protein
MNNQICPSPPPPLYIFISWIMHLNWISSFFIHMWKYLSSSSFFNRWLIVDRREWGITSIFIAQYLMNHDLRVVVVVVYVCCCCPSCARPSTYFGIDGCNHSPIRIYKRNELSPDFFFFFSSSSLLLQFVDSPHCSYYRTVPPFI